ncbi:lysophospholipid acyltransferase family protein [Paraurantiacibacter namhicola]|uniref:2-acyl-glycerophospho-ethanolamine acyltransferase n=1 Tax=Paraurantiacibacter namhicola TaxID=645517 RepID=A0A1C7D6I6_9SPHN|nr:lysophospholipid acyltransferase family protein [Paraurantiacibacter namhicola]ANU07070.1 2-acyl-glycerophospho-ethanolamine acyltransferase [Paraurantiacibacter namhicola]
MAFLRSLTFYFAFYIGSILFTVAALVTLPLSPRRFRHVPTAWSGFHRWCVRYLLGIRVVEEGTRHDGPVLYAIKHEAFFEAIDMPHLFSHPAGFAKEELFRIFGWGKVARRFGLIPVERDAGARALRFMIREAKERSEEGRPLVIFPEGTRIPHGECPPLRSGFAGIYKMLKLPVVPVAVNSGPLYHRPIKRSGTIMIRFGEVIPAGLPREEIEARVHSAINSLND